MVGVVDQRSTHLPHDAHSDDVHSAPIAAGARLARQNLGTTWGRLVDSL